MQKIISLASCISLAAILLSSCQSQKMENKSCFLLAGTYTANNNSDGIYVYDFNEDSGTLKLVAQTSKIANPSYLAFSKNYQYLYAVNENLDDSTPGMVSAFSFNQQDNISWEMIAISVVKSIATISAFGIANAHNHKWFYIHCFRCSHSATEPTDKQNFIILILSIVQTAIRNKPNSA